MNAKFYTTTAPAADPIVAADLEAALRLGSSFDSTTVSRVIPASVRKVEEDTERSLITRTITGKLDRWPKNGIIHLPKPPFVAITSFKYFDTNGDEQDLEVNTDYQIKMSGDSGRLVVAPGESWPSVQSDRLEPITITYTAGYGSSSTDVPDDLREACVKMGVMLYTNGAIDSTMYSVLIGTKKHHFDYHIND
jgi:uncharacterized phiE125 gp8 family phage protein